METAAMGDWRWAGRASLLSQNPITDMEVSKMLSTIAVQVLLLMPSFAEH
jgi:hypothetical protein